MYRIADHGAFISDQTRMDAYVRALGEAVKPGSAVMDIGTGVGIFALLACKFGARKVYAIESSNIIQLARENAVVNGYADRIEFIQELSTRIEIPERVDVIVSDLRGVLPFFQHNVSSVIDARERFLKPEGVLIPQRDFLWAALVEAPDLYRENLAVWETPTHDLALPAGRKPESNTFWKTRLELKQLITEPTFWGTLDYRSVHTPNVSERVEWTIEEARTAHGLLTWFDAELGEGIRFSNAPGNTRAVYGSAFFPFTNPVQLEHGDKAAVLLSGKLLGDEYLWRWDTTVFEQGNSQRVKANFVQSDFFAKTFSQAKLNNRAACHIPAIDPDLEAHRLILSLIDGRTSLEDIAREISRKFPERFMHWQDALAFAGAACSKVGNR